MLQIENFIITLWEAIDVYPRSRIAIGVIKNQNIEFSTFLLKHLQFPVSIRSSYWTIDRLQDLAGFTENNLK